MCNSLAYRVSKNNRCTRTLQYRPRVYIFKMRIKSYGGVMTGGGNRWKARVCAQRGEIQHRRCRRSRAAQHRLASSLVVIIPCVRVHHHSFVGCTVRGFENVRFSPIYIYYYVRVCVYTM